jgi:GNAT superfamily N-acetyltransferase
LASRLPQARAQGVATSAARALREARTPRPFAAHRRRCNGPKFAATGAAGQDMARNATRSARVTRRFATRGGAPHMPIARTATSEDLQALLDLFRVSEVSATVEPTEQAQDIWRQTLGHAGVTVFVSEAEAKIVATCMLITAPNLLRRGCGHGFLENVVAHPAFRGRGHGRAVIAAALSKAWATGCHHVLLQSGRRDPRVHHFYARCGFEPGLRIAYVARRPLKRQ